MPTARKEAHAGLTLTFQFERETKNTRRYSEVAEDGEAVVGTLYVQKSALDGLGDGDLTVTITPA